MPLVSPHRLAGGRAALARRPAAPLPLPARARIVALSGGGQGGKEPGAPPSGHPHHRGRTPARRPFPTPLRAASPRGGAGSADGRAGEGGGGGASPAPASPASPPPLVSGGPALGSPAAGEVGGATRRVATAAAVAGALCLPGGERAAGEERQASTAHDVPAPPAAASSSGPLLLWWAPDAPAELRALSFLANASVLGSASLAAGAGLAASLSAEGGPLAGAAQRAADAALAAAAAVPASLLPPFTAFVDAAAAPHALWAAYAAALAVHPTAVNAAVAAAAYGLGDVTAQAFEGRGLPDLDAPRAARSAFIGGAAWAPLAALFYEVLDRFVYVTPGFEGGDAWWSTLFKVGVDQTAWAGGWAAAYLALLALARGGGGGGAGRGLGPAGGPAGAASAWWDVLRAGWRVWPAVGLVTYGAVPLPHRVAFAALSELAWVTALGAYADTRRVAAVRRASTAGVEAAAAAGAVEAAGAAAGALEGGGGAAAAGGAAPPLLPPPERID